MKKLTVMIAAFVVAFTFTSCKNSSPVQQNEKMADNSENALDWDGVYSNVLPCADCEGLQTTIVLNKDQSYEKTTRYLGKEMDAIVKTGKFSWDKDGQNIVLEGNPGEEATHYFVMENKIRQLDINGKEIATENKGQYELPKVSNLVDRYWKLVEIFGQPVDSTGMKEPHLIFQVEKNRLVGNGGCNGLTATYILQNGNRVKFTPAAMTMMMCLNMDIETQFKKVLDMTDNYTLVGDTLTLNRARMAPLAKFVAN